MNKLTEKEKLEKEIFDTVYAWGQRGLVTTEKCNTFQSLLRKYRAAIRKEGQYVK